MRRHVAHYINYLNIKSGSSGGSIKKRYDTWETKDKMTEVLPYLLQIELCSPQIHILKCHNH